MGLECELEFLGGRGVDFGNFLFRDSGNAGTVVKGGDHMQGYGVGTSEYATATR